MGAYSFLDTQASLVGPGGSIQLGSGAGNAEEGLSYEMTEQKNTMYIGADGSGVNSLHAGKSGKIRVHVLKTSPINQQLSLMYNLQAASSALWGINVISIANSALGDNVIANQVAFAKNPNNQYSKDANQIEWEFDAITIDASLGSGIAPAIASFLAGTV